ncbi:MAG: hypothetical protein MUF34_27995 [Polyangiaceae bacterium]|jgi:hypothetical protein|nr:hypothetical protein [Polyangiaceae bacterium]
MVLVINSLNVLWFGAAFWYFALVPGRAAKVLVPRSQRASPLYLTLTASLRFLGAMNLALSVLALTLVLPTGTFVGSRQYAVLACVFALAHAGQLTCNVPIVLAGGRQGDALWPVTRGPMAFIFAVDGTLAFANAFVAARLFTS